MIHKQHTGQLYFILERAELCWNFSIVPQDGSDIHRLLTVGKSVNISHLKVQ